jgi:lysophospholipid acyltransferase (LPLAT)-like uncharacterized protein
MKRRLGIAAFLGAGFIKLLGRTWRVRTIDEHFMDDSREHSPALIFTFWHGRMLPLSYCYRGLAIQVLASEHRDGELMGQTIRRLGFGHVRGSSTRGGSRALRELVTKLAEGYDLGITVDGPTGPKHVFKAGPIEIAKISGSWIVPATTSSRKHWVTTSWDALEVPKPFTDVAIRFGRPVRVPTDATAQVIEEKRQEAEEILRAITRSNDESFDNG